MEMNGPEVDRRRATRAALKAALLPMMALAWPPGHLAAAEHRRAPAGRFMLTRRLRRELRAGQTISVTRAWEIGFASRAGGIAITGTQLSAEVEAPTALAMLADIERRRVAEGMFPLILDATGMIVGSGDNRSDPALADAIDTARQIFAGVIARTEAAHDINQFMAQVGQTSADAVSRLPRDLFYPRGSSHQESRVVSLAGGDTGEVEVTTSSRTARDGLLIDCRRIVITRMGGTSRATAEDWSLIRL